MPNVLVDSQIIHLQRDIKLHFILRMAEVSNTTQTILSFWDLDLFLNPSCVEGEKPL